jgi:hypothetical protein
MLDDKISRKKGMKRKEEKNRQQPCMLAAGLNRREAEVRTPFIHALSPRVSRNRTIVAAK